MEPAIKGNQNIDTVLANQISAEQHSSDTALRWAEANLPADDCATVRDRLLTGKVEMRRIDKALHTNPAAAIFGESQVGKSYLVSNLLKNASDNFCVKYPGMGEVDFISELNPLGGGAESTSLITRFTVRPSKSPDPSFPIKAGVFSPSDMALIIADSFYSDIKNHQFPSMEQLEAEVAAIMEKYGSMNPVQNYLTAEDICEMSLYLQPERFPISSHWLGMLHSSGYFKRLATVIANVAPSAWKDVFSVLWNHNPILSDIFSRQVRLLHELDFARSVFIDIDPLRNATGTILSVDRIREFFGLTTTEDGKKVNTAEVPEMRVWTPAGVRTVKKSEFTSVTAEVVLEVPDDVAAEKSFLNNLDILDFPGARTRENTDEKEINADRACNMVLRGRVAYLFNKYSRSYLITSLLFCYHDEQSNVKTLSELLRNWIGDMVGHTPQERANSLTGADVPPLFIVGTKFNNDLERNNKSEKADADEEQLQRTAVNRWANRFDKFLLDIVDGRDPRNWYNDWTPGKAFDNLYLLRDYSFSDKVFDGYLETGAESAVKELHKPFLQRLRDTFLAYPAVQTHFHDPEKAWDMAATPGNDGSQYIIDNLVKASKVAIGQRNRRFSSLVLDNFKTMFETLGSFYHDDDASSRIIATLRDAGRLSLIFDTLFSSRPHFFPELLSALLISEDKLHDKVLDVATEMKLLKDTDITPLLAIRKRAGIDSSRSDAENIRRLLSVYHLPDVHSIEDFLQREGFTIDDVLHPSSAKNLTQILVEEMERYWLHNNINTTNLERFKEYGLSDADLEALVGSLRALYVNKLGIGQLIMKRLRRYITTPDRLDDMADLIADLTAETFNKFVNSFGAAFFPESLTAEVEATAAKENILLADDEDSGEYDRCEFNERKSLECIGKVFNTFEKVDDVLNNPEEHTGSLEYFSNYTSFRSWTDNMMRGFLASCDIPKYDIARNESLRAMLVEAFGSEAFDTLMEAEPELNGKMEKMKKAGVRPA